MTNHIHSLVISIIILLISSCDDGTDKQKLLIVTGGHGFEREQFFDIFKNMPNTEFHEVVQPEANQLYASGSLDTIDVLVFYDMVQEITESQKKDFLDLLEKGMPIVFLHHALVSYQEWDEFFHIIGGRYVTEGDSADLSSYRHDVDIEIEIVDPSHPVTKGLEDFMIYDEVYGNFMVSDQVTPLLKTNHPESTETVAWCHTYDKSRIVYIQLGHGPSAFEDANFLKLLSNALQWVQLGD